ncbi:30S ribosome-binding factor RbfA [Uliginosibacterium sediminicola]|uniref:Ribosome-binding factor A n=1 Tax=Uliginosibacterium sediminicola TaxID=2024550 RepID=A0ABU9YZ05_9RHOO
MPKDYSRSSRVVEQIKRELAELIRLEVKDPRVGFITLTDVEITADYAHAKVFFSSLKGQDNIDEVLVGLRRASGFLRRELGRRVRIHTTPELHFVYDNSIEEGTRMSALISKVIAETPPAEDDEPGTRET